ncbi:MAG TPA: hypothetical protein VFT47_04360 [Vicinamibacterales bacterium]|nr:hypothetical protein [Vicinamibacterales bacterium]
MSHSRKTRRVGVLTGALVLLAGCSSILDVKNPNDVPENALDQPSAAPALMNGVVGATSRMLSAVTVPYSVATDELDWIGSRDAWGDLETGVITNFANEFTDGAFPFVGEARYLGDDAIRRIEKFEQDGFLKDSTVLAQTYLYTAVTYATIADMYDDFALSSKREGKAPIGRAQMSTLYDKAVVYLTNAVTIAQAVGDADLEYQATAYRARVKHAKGVWGKIPKGSVNIAAPLVNDAGANADATAAITLKPGDTKFTLDNNVEANAGINIWFEVNGRNEHRTGTVYRNLVDPVTAVKDSGMIARLKEFTDFGTQSGTFTLTSNRELRLILAEAALAANDIATFTTQINAVRTLDKRPIWAGTPAAQAILVYERQSQLWLMRRRLSDMYRFNLKAVEWKVHPVYESAFNVGGLLFPIANVERLSNVCIAEPSSAGC